MQGQQNNLPQPTNKPEEEMHKEQQQPNKNPPSSPSQSYSQRNSQSRSDSSSSRSSSPSQKQNQGNQGNKDQKQGKKQGNENQSQKKIRYKYCCKICKHTDAYKKACVCVVPKGQRRTEIGEQGCQTCACNGCSKQDFISRGEDPEYKPGEKKQRRKQKQTSQFQARNGCCRKCMKAFSKSNKSCLCQVPQDVRNTKLPSSGCKICGCFGCNPQDKKDPRSRKASKKQKQRSRSRQKRGRKHVRQNSQQSHSREYIDPLTMNFYNVEKSVIGGMITNEYRLDPSLLGFGIPQRTHNYIIGKPK